MENGIVFTLDIYKVVFKRTDLPKFQFGWDVSVSSSMEGFQHISGQYFFNCAEEPTIKDANDYVEYFKGVLRTMLKNSQAPTNHGE